jgi:hypothetical protein
MRMQRCSDGSGERTTTRPATTRLNAEVHLRLCRGIGLLDQVQVLLTARR